MCNDWLTIGNITIHGYGVMIGIGFLAAIYISYIRAKKKELDADFVLDIALIAIIGGFLGAKLLYIIINFKRLFTDPLSVIGLSGFVVYGGVIVAIIVGFFWIKKKKQDFLEYFDLVMPAVALAQGIGRIGCFFAGCCYGKPTDSIFGIAFPVGEYAGIKVWPTQLFSSAGDLIIAAVLFIISGKRKKKGDVGALYLVLYGIGRFLVEFLRGDTERGAVAFLSTSQFISLFVVLIGVALLVFFRMPKKAVKEEEKEKDESDTM